MPLLVFNAILTGLETWQNFPFQFFGGLVGGSLI
jgi:hypothetical protein